MSLPTGNPRVAVTHTSFRKALSGATVPAPVLQDTAVHFLNNRSTTPKSLKLYAKWISEVNKGENSPLIEELGEHLFFLEGLLDSASISNASKKKLLFALMNSFPTRPRPLFFAGYRHYRKKEWTEAAATLKRAVEALKNPNNLTREEKGRLHYILAKAVYKTGDVEGTAKALKKSLTANPFQTEAYYSFALMLYRPLKSAGKAKQGDVILQGKIDKAKRYLERALSNLSRRPPEDTRRAAEEEKRIRALLSEVQALAG